MERVHMDMLGPFPVSEWGNKYILVMVDQFTKWVEIHAIPDISAEQTARSAVDHMFSRFGAPLQIHTDQGKNFDGNVMKALCDLFRITKTRTTPYRPCSNGQVERYNRLLLQMIRCYLRAKDRTWDQDLQLLAGAIRAMEHRSTGYSANMMMLGTEVLQPIDILFRSAGEQFRNENPAEYVKHLRETLREVHELAAEKLRTQLRYQKRTYDLKLFERHYEVGDLVYRLNGASKTGESRKLKPVWIGPLVVTEVLNPVLYKVKDRKKEYILHHDRLKLCEDRNVPLWLRKMRHNLLDLDTTIGYDASETEDDIPLPVIQPGKRKKKNKQPGANPRDIENVEIEAPTLIDEADNSDKEENPPAGDIPPQQPQKQDTSIDKTIDASDLMLVSEDLGLDKLFDDKEVVHVYAKIKQPPPKAKEKKRVESEGEVDSSESKSKPGRRRKLPGYLQDYSLDL
jgi:hypothetical protein